MMLWTPCKYLVYVKPRSYFVWFTLVIAETGKFFSVSKGILDLPRCSIWTKIDLRENSHSQPHCRWSDIFLFIKTYPGFPETSKIESFATTAKG